MLILVLLVLVVIVFSMSEVYADTFQSYENDNYLFLEISDDTAFILLRMDGKIISIQEDVNYYKNGNFKINFENKIMLFGAHSDDEIKIRIKDFEKNQKITLMLQRIDTDTSYEKPIIEELTVLEKFENSKKTTGMELVVPLKISNAQRLPETTKISRSQYIESEDKEIKILFQITKRISYYNEFFFNIRAVDPAINGVGNNFWNDMGFVNDVEISSIIANPNGKILNEFTGNTTENGYYASPRILFPYNSIMFGPYTMEVNATKYFDESATFATNSITEEFFVFVPNNKKSVTECNYLFEKACVATCPEGTDALKPQPPYENNLEECIGSD